jgi:hypothetical protein
MAAGRIFCTGEVDPSDFANMIRLYGTSHLLIADDRHAGGFHLSNPLADNFPIARIDPGADRIELSATGNLVIPSGASIATIAQTLNRWTAQRPETDHG